MNKKFYSFLLILFVIGNKLSLAQLLRSELDTAELITSMQISAYTGNENGFGGIKKPQDYIRQYQSKELGLANLWEYWQHKDQKLGILSIRGTADKGISWTENFYAAMVPAKGTLRLDSNFNFEYNLSDNPLANVHIGWMIGLAYVAQEMVPYIKVRYEQDQIKDFILTGHSQGGAVILLMTAHLRRLQLAGKLPQDIQFKTYATAGPKPGNAFFANELAILSQNKWTYNVINDKDWVPEVPLSIQRLDNFNEVNPFELIKSKLKKASFPKNIVLKYAYNRLDKPTKRAQKNYEKYLGDYVNKMIRKHLPNYQAPKYVDDNNYCRAGNVIIIKSNNPAYEKQSFIKTNAFMAHHLPDAYIYILKNNLK